MSTINASDGEKWGSNQWVNEGKAIVVPKYFEHHPADSRVQGSFDVANTVSARYGTGGGNTPMVAHAFKVRGGKEGGGKGYLGSDDTAFTVSTMQDQHIAQPIPLNTMTIQGRPSDDINPRMGSGIGQEGDPAPIITKGHSHAVAQPMAFDAYNQTINPETSQTLSSAASDITHTGGVVTGMVVRRLTPTECERLQGFPDGYTNIPWRGKPESPDGPRYKALGNSMAVPVMRWIGRRIQEIDKHLQESHSQPIIEDTSFEVIGFDPRSPDGFARITGNVSSTLNAMGGGQREPCVIVGLSSDLSVRKLTPIECERLQGFPDGYTNIPWRNKPEAPDGPRYKALGNSMAVPVMNWIGRRIQEIDKHL